MCESETHRGENHHDVVEQLSRARQEPSRLESVYVDLEQFRVEYDVDEQLADGAKYRSEAAEVQLLEFQVQFSRDLGLETKSATRLQHERLDSDFARAITAQVLARQRVATETIGYASQ